MSFAKQNPKIPEGINTSTDNPLKEFLILFVGIVVVLCAIVALLVIFAHSLAPHIPFRYEQQLMNKYGQWTESKAQSVAEPSAAFRDAETAIKELGQSLTAHAELDTDISTQFHLLDQANTPNAYATLGGHIFITTGLLAEVSSENALAMVLAHEIAHIKFRHPAQSLSGGLLVQLFLSIITGGQNASALQSTAQQTGMLTVLGFSRKMESTADDAALDTLIKYYGHLAGTADFFTKILAQYQQASWQALFTSHPDLSQRISQIQARTKLSAIRQIKPYTKELDPRLRNLQSILADNDY